MSKSTPPSIPHISSYKYYDEAIKQINKGGHDMRNFTS